MKDYDGNEIDDAVAFDRLREHYRKARRWFERFDMYDGVIIILASVSIGIMILAYKVAQL